MIDCDGIQSSNLFSDADFEIMKTMLAAINYPAKVRGLRLGVFQYHLIESGTPSMLGRLRRYLEAVHYIRPSKAQLILTLPKYDLQQPVPAVVTTESQANEILDLLLQFKISFRGFQINEPYTTEWCYSGSASIYRPALSVADAVTQANAYRAALDARGFGNRPLYLCPSIAKTGGTYDWEDYFDLDHPWDVHQHMTSVEGEIYDNGSERYDLATTRRRKGLICTESNTWLTAEDSASYFAEEHMLAALTATEHSAKINHDFCWHNLSSNNHNNGTDDSHRCLFFREVSSGDMSIHPIIEESFIV